MGCMGPNKDHADKQGEEAFAEIMELLKAKYDVQAPTPGSVVTWTGPNGEEMTVGRSISKQLNTQWFAAEEDLKKAICELIWCQRCCDF